PQHPGGADRGGAPAGVLDGRVRRPGVRVRLRWRPGRPAGRLRLRPAGVPQLGPQPGQQAFRRPASPRGRRPYACPVSEPTQPYGPPPGYGTPAPGWGTSSYGPVDGPVGGPVRQETEPKAVVALVLAVLTWTP